MLGKDFYFVDCGDIRGYAWVKCNNSWPIDSDDCAVFFHLLLFHHGKVRYFGGKLTLDESLWKLSKIGMGKEQRIFS